MRLPAGGPGVDTSYRLYLREIGKIRRLPREEEMFLARRAQAGDEAAREELIKCRLPLVVKLAREYEGLGLPLLDLVGEGNLGLMKAVARFDPGRGVGFATYAAWWIKQAMRRALATQVRIVRLPESAQTRVFRINRALWKLTQVLERVPTDDELGQSLGMPLREVTRLREASQSTVFVQDYVSDENGRRIGELIADEQAVSPLELAEREGQYRLLQELLAKLTACEHAVLCQRFGLECDRGGTLAEVGQRFGKTREWARLTQNRALGRLRRILQSRT